MRPMRLPPPPPRPLASPRQRRQLDLRGLAAAHNQLPLREGQKDIRVPRVGERHVVAALRQRRLRHAVAVRRHVALTDNVQRQTGERLFLPLAQRGVAVHGVEHVLLVREDQVQVVAAVGRVLVKAPCG